MRGFGGFSLDRDTMATMSTSMRFIILRSIMTRVRLTLSFSYSVVRPRLKFPSSSLLQIRRRKTSRTPKTLRISKNTTWKPTRRSGSRSSTACRSSSRTSRRSFGARHDPPSLSRGRIFYFIAGVLSWVRFWDFAAADFIAHYPLTYFVLYCSLLVLAVLLAYP